MRRGPRREDARTAEQGAQATAVLTLPQSPSPTSSDSAMRRPSFASTPAPGSEPRGCLLVTTTGAQKCGCLWRREMGSLRRSCSLAEKERDTHRRHPDEEADEADERDAVDHVRGRSE